MEKRHEALHAIYTSPEGKKLYKSMKKGDKSGGCLLSILQAITVLATILFAILGYLIVYGYTGMRFGMIAGIIPLALFGLICFLKAKKSIAKVGNYFHDNAPALVAKAAGVELATENMPYAEAVNEMAGGSFSPIACHRYGDIYMGYKQDADRKNLVSQLVYCVKGEYTPNSELEAFLKKRFDKFTIKSVEGNTLLYIPEANGYLFAIFTDDSDSVFEQLATQYDYYLLGVALKKTVNGEEADLDLFDSEK